MKYEWINLKNNQNLIIFFNGWGMDDCVVRHLDASGYDVLMFYDYNNLETDFNFSILDNYSKKNLVAWSMGVMVATIFDFIKYDSATAINGTLKPIDDQFGIPERIYNLTIRGFNELGAKKFIHNMFVDKIHIPNCKRSIENQKSELVALKQYSSSIDFKYNKILLSDEDKIIPTKNQVAYWKIQPNIKSGHCPFFSYSSWKELI